MTPCRFENCTNEQIARGMCRYHYNQWYVQQLKDGVRLKEIPAQAMPTEVIPPPVQESPYVPWDQPMELFVPSYTKITWPRYFAKLRLCLLKQKYPHLTHREIHQITGFPTSMMTNALKPNYGEYPAERWVESIEAGIAEYESRSH